MNRAEYLVSPLLSRAGFRHAFFTRRGGVSSGPFRSLNFSIKVGDTPENVARNLERAAASLNMLRSEIFFASQVHGRTVRELTERDTPEELVFVSADALVARRPGLGCAVRTADCVPILLADPQTGAVGAAHAGWRGVVSGILDATLESLRGFGASADRLIAAVGPHISRAAFEVSEDVAQAIAGA
ncbi:MAG TPA: polyphenol oxidase family protein, partial [Polyangiaceae bacterium]|nr:polyphenol oxidase family protein [Polyangiaceae bacterium]